MAKSVQLVCRANVQGFEACEVHITGYVLAGVPGGAVDERT
ncbi:hypothetical protein AB5J49_07550 [Streptomyces sp. R28]|uniref:Uncharacterized protein n=1 Tax=Streptomyces sp. R28 TaxID=3238628 RepID=A0AB39PR22_9ACTN